MISTEKFFNLVDTGYMKYVSTEDQQEIARFVRENKVRVVTSKYSGNTATFTFFMLE